MLKKPSVSALIQQGVEWNEMYKDLSDSQLLTRFRESTDQARGEILLAFYERYKNLVLKVCYHYLGDYDQANDVFHDAFTKVLEKVETIPQLNNFKSWLLTITRNLCVDRLRHASYLKGQEGDSALIEVSCENRVEARYVAEMDRQKILGHLVSCVQNLAASDLRIFKLRWRGLRAAQILKIVESNKAELRRSYDRIKNLLEVCMKKKGLTISIDQIISLGELDE
jgi:RNA polymerase sigma-70 factor (ECF subfamily)